MYSASSLERPFLWFMVNEFLSKFANLARNAPKVLEMQSECSK